MQTCGHFFYPAPKFQEYNALEFLKIFMFRASRQVAIYIQTAALEIRYNNKYTSGKPLTFFGVFRPPSRRYSTDKNKIMDNDTVDKIIDKM